MMREGSVFAFKELSVLIEELKLRSAQLKDDSKLNGVLIIWHK